MGLPPPQQTPTSSPLPALAFALVLLLLLEPEYFNKQYVGKYKNIVKFASWSGVYWAYLLVV
ncbi:Protein of unknown function [Gryllus bimaculatus]|nr:Protein of unknown function [Gryllus bimaculatus]